MALVAKMGDTLHPQNFSLDGFTVCCLPPNGRILLTRGPSHLGLGVQEGGPERRIRAEDNLPQKVKTVGFEDKRMDLRLHSPVV